MKIKYRNLEKTLLSIISPNAVIELRGLRSIGKSTLLKNLKIDNDYIDCSDEKNTINLHQNLSETFNSIISKTKNKIIIFDEAQLIPNLTLEIKKSIDNKSGLTFILSGSRSLERTALSGTDPLAGRITATLILEPFTLSELDSRNDDNAIYKYLISEIPELPNSNFNSNDFEQYIINGGLWNLQAKDEVRRKLFINSFFDSLLSKTLIPENLDRQALIEFTKSIINYSSQVLNITKISKELALRQETIKKYLNILKSIHLISTNRAIKKQSMKELAAQPKLFINDTGILSARNDIHNWSDLDIRNRGSYFETCVVNLIRTRNGMNLSSHEIKYWRNERSEIDIILQKNNDLIAIEVKSTNNIENIKVNNFKQFEKEWKKNINKFIIYGGEFPSTINDIKIIPSHFLL